MVVSCGTGREPCVPSGRPCGVRVPQRSHARPHGDRTRRGRRGPQRDKGKKHGVKGGDRRGAGADERGGQGGRGGDGATTSHCGLEDRTGQAPRGPELIRRPHRDRGASSLALEGPHLVNSAARHGHYRAESRGRCRPLAPAVASFGGCGCCGCGFHFGCKCAIVWSYPHPLRAPSQRRSPPSRSSPQPRPR